MHKKFFTKKSYILLLITISLIIRILILPFHMIPHDFSANIGAGKCMAEGKYLMWNCAAFFPRDTPNSNYGPLYSIISMFWYLIFSEDIFMYKVLSVIFDILNCVILYFILRKFFSEHKSFYLSLLFSLSFFALFASSAIGENGTIFMSFFLLSIYYLINKKPFFSSILYSVSIMIKSIPLAIFPILILYVWRKYGLKWSIKYVFLSLAVALIIISPFIYLVGFEDALFSFMVFSSKNAFYQTASQMNFFNVVKLSTNLDLTYLNKYFLVVSYALAFLYALINKIKDKELELFRNINLIFTVGLLFGFYLTPYYFYTVFPFFILMLSKKLNPENKFIWIGTSLVVAGLIIYSIIYKWGLVSYNETTRMLLVISIFLIPAGSFIQLKQLKLNYKIVYVLIVLGSIMFEELHAAPFEILIPDGFSEWINLKKMTVSMSLFGDHITSKKKFLAYGISYGGSSAIMWIGLIYLIYLILKDDFNLKNMSFQSA